VSGRRVGKTRRHVFKTNCGRHLKKQHFQLSLLPLAIIVPPVSVLPLAVVVPPIALLPLADVIPPNGSICHQPP